jgi:hypothetical protein
MLCYMKHDVFTPFFLSNSSSPRVLQPTPKDLITIVTMQFTALPLLALAASVSALKSAWNVTRFYRDVSQQVVGYSLTAVFVSDDYPGGLESKCTWVQKALPPLSIDCTPDSFSVEPQPDGCKYLPTTQTTYGGLRGLMYDFSLQP